MTLGAGVRVGRNSGVGDWASGDGVPPTGVIASGVRIEPNPWSKIGVGGTRVPAGVDVTSLPAAETITTWVLGAPLSGVGKSSGRLQASSKSGSARGATLRLEIDTWASQW